jgi:hypothetical protein
MAQVHLHDRVAEMMERAHSACHVDAIVWRKDLHRGTGERQLTLLDPPHTLERLETPYCTRIDQAAGVLARQVFVGVCCHSRPISQTRLPAGRRQPPKPLGFDILPLRKVQGHFRPYSHCLDDDLGAGSCATRTNG